MITCRVVHFYRKMVTDSIELDPNYGAYVDFWVYAPLSKKWVQSTDPAFPLGIRYDATDKKFLKAIKWLNIGAMMFLKGVNPNEMAILSPVVLPEYFCKEQSIIQDSLKDAVASGSLAVIALSEGTRTFSNEAFLERKQRSVDLAKEKVKQTQVKAVTTDDVIALLKEGWQQVAITTPARLKFIAKKHEIEYNDDQSSMRIKED